MCCKDLHFQCCAAVSVFLSFSRPYLHHFYSSCMLVCHYNPAAKYRLFFFLLCYSPVIALPLCLWIYMCIYAHIHVCHSALCLVYDIMCHHHMSTFPFIYGWLLLCPTYQSLDISISKPTHACLTPYIHL